MSPLKALGVVLAFLAAILALIVGLWALGSMLLVGVLGWLPDATAMLMVALFIAACVAWFMLWLGDS